MNEHRASAAVTPMVPVPGWQPGMTPMMELAQMKKNSAARNGKCFFQVFSPTMDFTMSSRTNSTTYSTPFTNRPCGTRLADCFFLNTKSTTSIRMSATASQNVYVVRPTVVLPTMAWDMKLSRRESISSGSLSSGDMHRPFACPAAAGDRPLVSAPTRMRPLRRQGFYPFVGGFYPEFEGASPAWICALLLNPNGDTSTSGFEE